MANRKFGPCYWCGEPGMSNEHVPPECFFPDDPKLKRNLITVPSCKEHNLKKSNDDQYIFAVISGSIAVNPHAYEGTRHKVIRSIQKRETLEDKRALLETFYPELRPVNFGGTHTGMFEVDIERFQRCLSQMARALYYKQFKRRWTPQIEILAGNLLPVHSPHLDQYNLEVVNLFAMASQLFKNQPWAGWNEPIFRFKLWTDFDAVEYVALMDFYEGFPVLAQSTPFLRKPNLLVGNRFQQTVNPLRPVDERLFRVLKSSGKG